MKKVNLLELSSIIFFITISLTSGINLNLIIKNTGINSWLTISLSYLFGYIPLLLILKISSYKEEYSLPKKIINLYNKFGYVINLLIEIIFIILAITILYNINNFIVSQYLYHTPIFISTLLFISIVTYTLIKGNNALPRLSFILYIVYLSIFFISFLSLTNKIDITNFYPLLKENTNNIISTSIKISIINTLPLILILIIPKNSITRKNQYNKTILISYTISAIFAILISTGTIATLGIDLAKLFQYPEYIVLRKVTLFDFLERIENLLAMQWPISFLVYLSIIIYYLKENIIINLNIHNNKIKNIITISISTLIYILALLIFKDNSLFQSYINKLLPYLILPLSLIYILILIKIMIKRKN